MPGLLLLALLAIGGPIGCAPAETVPPPGPDDPVGDGGADADSAIVVETEDDSPEGLALTAAEQAWVDGDFLTAAVRTDSLSRAWTRRRDLDADAVRRLARLLLVRAEDVETVDQFLYHPTALDESWRQEMRAAVERLSLSELDELSRRITRDDRVLGIVRAEEARALALTGDDERARETARELLRDLEAEDEELYEADERKVDAVLDGRITPAEPGIRIGFIAPRSGGFEAVGDQLVEGARLAASAYEEETGVPVELVVVDEERAIDSTGVNRGVFGDGLFRRTDPVSDDTTGAEGLEGEAEGEAEDAIRDESRVEVIRTGRGDGTSSSDLAAVVGPVMSEGLRAAATARSAPGLLLLSPTASEDSALAPHAYTLWDRAQRDSLEATALGNWLVSAFEPRTIVVVHPDSAPPLPAAREEPARVAALHPDTDSGFRRVRMLRDIAESAGFAWVGSEPYSPDSTTYQEQIERLTDADPDFVYTIADGPRQVLQIAPQLHFYGLRGRIILANQDWTHPTALRRLDEAFSDYRVTPVYFEREGNPHYERFAARWDETYRRSVPPDAFGALGYDAVSLVLDAVEDPALARPAAVARAMTRIDEVEGVTGRFSFDPDTRRLVRDVRMRMILHSELVDPDPGAILEWSIETRSQEERRLAREAREEAEDG